MLIDPGTGSERGRVAAHLRAQAGHCGDLGSPLYAHLLERAADDVAGGGVVWRALEPHAGRPEGFFLSLRLMGAVHRVVLEGRAPGLAAHYPSAGGRWKGSGVWDAFRATVAEHSEDIGFLLDRPPQTNEVGRAQALIGGFLLVARATALPLRCLEIGASGGLNLRWDHYRYEARGRAWGPADSPVRLCDFDGPSVPPFAIDAHVAERRGCDTNPIDPTTDEGSLTLLSYVWADQIARIRLLRTALQVAQRVPVTVDREDASTWSERHLAEPAEGIATVVYHSVVLQYFSDEERRRFQSVLEEAGRRARRTAPLAWLRMEWTGRTMEVRLTMWPAGHERLLAQCGGHGNRVRWFAAEG